VPIRLPGACAWPGPAPGSAALLVGSVSDMGPDSDMAEASRRDFLPSFR
jgi:hypothetical protein